MSFSDFIQYESQGPVKLLQMVLFPSFYVWVFHCVYVYLCVYIYKHTYMYTYTTFLYICRWTFRLLSCLDYCKQCLYEHCGACIFLYYFLWMYGPGVGLRDHMTTPFLGFKGTSVLFSIVAAPIYIPTNNMGRFHFPHTLSSIYYL